MAFFTQDEFNSTLKGCAVDDMEYNNSKMLYRLLKMRNFFDLNDLYNVQDVFFLCEIIENYWEISNHVRTATTLGISVRPAS